MSFYFLEIQKEQIVPVANMQEVTVLPPINSTNKKSSNAMANWTEDNIKKWLVEKDLKEVQKR